MNKNIQKKIEKINNEYNNILNKEYILSNNKGGYMSSLVTFTNIRKYSGLLVAATNFPANRNVLLAKLDESITINNNEYILYTNMSKYINEKGEEDLYISDGYKYIKDYYVKNNKLTVNYEVDFKDNNKEKHQEESKNNITIKKEVLPISNENTSLIKYSIENNTNENVIFNISPIITNRNFHHLLNSDEDLNYLNELSKSFNKGNSDLKLYINCDENIDEKITYTTNIFNNMYYYMEEERGFDSIENLIVPCTYKINVNKNSKKEVIVIATYNEAKRELELNNFKKDNKINEINYLEYCNNLIKNEGLAASEIVKELDFVKKEKYKKKEEISNEEKEKSEFLKDLVISSNNFIISRGEFKSIIAGYPWFMDWTRDTLIAFEGLLLKTKKYNDAKLVLQLLLNNINFGLVPNAFSEQDDSKYFNSADSSLLLFEAIAKYLDYTNDLDFIINDIDNVYTKLINIFNYYLTGTNYFKNNIYLDTKDFLLVNGTSTIQNTWMDAIVENTVVTPRNGKRVDINSLWYNAICILKEFSKIQEDKNTIRILDKYITGIENTFVNNFKSTNNNVYNYLKDGIDDSSIRPNMLFSISLKFNILKDINLIKGVLDTTKEELLTNYGIRSLAKNDKKYISTYEGDSSKRDYSYHMGISWVFLLQNYYKGLLYYKEVIQNEIKQNKEISSFEKTKYIKEIKKVEKEILEFKTNIYTNFKEIFYNGNCLHTFSELNDSNNTYLPKGAISQAWSVAAIINILLD